MENLRLQWGLFFKNPLDGQEPRRRGVESKIRTPATTWIKNSKNAFLDDRGAGFSQGFRRLA